MSKPVRFVQLLPAVGYTPPSGLNLQTGSWTTLYALDDAGRVWMLGFDANYKQAWILIPNPTEPTETP